MPIGGVLEHVKKTLQGITVAPFDAADVHINPLPITETDGRPQIFIWYPTSKERRRSSPRAQPGNPSTGGAKLATHTIKLTCLAIYDYESTIGQDDLSFSNFLEGILEKLRTDPMPTTLTDPSTGALSQLLNVGEEFDVTTDIVRAVADQRQLRWFAEILATIQETFQA